MTAAPAATDWGLSPRRRGNPSTTNARAPCARPIPAQAGEPEKSYYDDDANGAYPRAGGGTSTRWATTADSSGLSPRRRGNQGVGERAAGPEGPIPAQAGEPLRRHPRFVSCRAYPRAGGGTHRGILAGAGKLGLSPRRRGNQFIRKERDYRLGPIPAQAGEPDGSCGRLLCSRAYPRAGGGTAESLGALGINPRAGGGTRVEGLSPRRRGNPLVPSL